MPHLRIWSKVVKISVNAYVLCSVRWRRRDGRSVDDSWQQSDGTLELPADVSNAGLYQCLAENDAGVAVSNYTAVHGKLVHSHTRGVARNLFWGGTRIKL